jgi:predicted outer membrane repeat protein
MSTRAHHRARACAALATVLAAFASFGTAPAAAGIGGGVAGVNGLTCSFPTVEDALLEAPEGSTIYIKPGRYQRTEGPNNFFAQRDLTLARGTATCGPMIGGSPDDVVLAAAPHIHNQATFSTGAPDREVLLDRITIEGGDGDQGAVIVHHGGHLTLNNVVVRGATNPTKDGGGLLVQSGATMTVKNGSRIIDNAAVNGGGADVRSGTLHLTGDSDILGNTATGDGGGIHATDGSLVIVDEGSDVFANEAADGGGIFADDSSVLVSGAGTSVGLTGNPNAASVAGGGVFATNGADVTVGSGAGVRANTSSGIGGGMRAFDGATVQVDPGGVITQNVANGFGGGGIYASGGATIDLNPGSSITGNTAAVGFGGGVATFGTLDVDGGTTTPMQPVAITGNTAATTGGGLYVGGGTASVDTARVSGNHATVGGGGAHVAGGALAIDETGSCSLAALGMDEYCNELRGNTTSGTGGALAVTGGSADIGRVGIAGNHADEAAVLVVTGSGQAALRSVVAFGNTEAASPGVDGLVTAQGSATLSLIGVTFAGQTEPFLDTDDSPTVVTSRVLTTTPALTLAARPTGSCNLGPSGAGLPGQVVAAPVFAVDPTEPGNPSYVATHRSAFLPTAGSPARDACTQLGGLATDARDTGELNGAGSSRPGRDWDIGGLEAAPK